MPGQSHAYISHKLLYQIVFLLRPAIDIPHLHHERWDGTGCPRGLKGGEIPLPARVFSGDDVWEALRSARDGRGIRPSSGPGPHMLIYQMAFDLKCRCCRSGELEMVLDLGSQPWGNHYKPLTDPGEIPRFPLELYFCRNCYMVQIGYTVKKEFMFREHNYLSGTTRSLRLHFENVCGGMLSMTKFASGDYVLDIGGNDGTFLSCFKQRGIDVLNVDSGVKQARISNESGIPCLNEFFNESCAEKILSEKGPARAIHGSGIFFHLEELHSVFEGIKILLKRDGLLVAEFIYLPEMIKENAFDQIYHEHLLYYTIATFGKVLKQHGLIIYDAELAPIHGGSCIAYIGHDNGVTATKRLEDLLSKEEAGKYDNVATYRRFSDRVSVLKENLRNMIFDLKEKGKKIQALGAPVKGSTIINYCGLDCCHIDCAVEINELKCNTFMPGTRIPVYHQDKAPVPDVYLMLAWNFRDEILEKIGRFRSGGGKILVPIPSPELI